MGAWNRRDRAARLNRDDAASVDGAKVVLVPVEDVEMHWDDLHASDAIVFGSPTYRT